MIFLLKHSQQSVLPSSKILRSSAWLKRSQKSVSWLRAATNPNHEHPLEGEAPSLLWLTEKQSHTEFFTLMTKCQGRTSQTPLLNAHNLAVCSYKKPPKKTVFTRVAFGTLARSHTRCLHKDNKTTLLFYIQENKATKRSSCLAGRLGERGDKASLDFCYRLCS